LRASFQAKEKEWERARSSLESRIAALADQSTAAKRALDLERKLTQAGSHLKTLAQENARLTKLQQQASAGTVKIDQYKDVENRLKDSEQEIEKLKASLSESENERQRVEGEKDQEIKNRDTALQAQRDEERQAYLDELEKLRAEKQASEESVNNLVKELERLRLAKEEHIAQGNVNDDNGLEEIKETFQVRERELMDLVEALDTLANSNKSVVLNAIELPTTPLLAKIKELEEKLETKAADGDIAGDTFNDDAHEAKGRFT
jgi:chromosome segregation ATPase